MEVDGSKIVMEGVSNEVIAVSIGFVALVAFVIFNKFKSWLARTGVSAIHPDSENTVSETRQRLIPRSSREQENNANCPVCLDSIQYGLETNCAHVFCGNCIVTYWKTGRWLGPVACPNCRQTVTILLNSFTSAELSEEDSEVKNMVLQEVLNYNRRFSGEPRSVWEYLQDLPALLRHAISDVFSVDGMVFVFRARIFVCIAIALLYLLSPLDIIPEMAVGILGLVDDIFIVFIIAIYISMIYRNVIASRAAAINPHED